MRGRPPIHAIGQILDHALLEGQASEVRDVGWIAGVEAHCFINVITGMGQQRFPEQLG